MNLKKFFTLKRILLSFAVLILIACIACVSVLLIRHHKKLERFNRAKQAYLDEKYEDAKPLLRECLNDQYNDEEVNVMLAKIAENEGEWPQAVWHWQRASRLNPFKTEYSDNHINALKMSRDFNLAAETLEIRRTQNTITQEQYLLLAFCQYMLGKQAEAKETLENVTDEAAKQKELAVILNYLLSDSEHTIEQDLEFLKPFQDSTDKFIAFEAALASAIRYARQNDLENGKKCMEKAAEIFPLLGKPLQAEYLYRFGIISEAMVIFEECMQRYTSNEMGQMLGECYTITGQPAKLAELHKKFLSGSNTRIITGLYLEALYAYLTNDETLLTQNIAKWQDNFNTAIATLVKLYAATCADNLEETLKYLSLILRYQQRSPSDGKGMEALGGNSPNTLYFNIHGFAYNIGLRYVTKLVEKKQDAKAAEIALILQQYETPKLLPGLRGPNRILAQLAVGHKLVHDTLTQSDIDDVMQKFPGDPFLVNYISRYYLAHGDFSKSIELAKSNLEKLRALREKQASEGKEASWDMTPFVVQLLGALESDYRNTRNEANKLEADGKKDEAKQLRDKLQKQMEDTKQAAKALLMEKDEIADNILYIDFCFRNRLVNDLKEYAASIKEDDTDNTKALKYFASAQAAILPEEETTSATQKLTEEEFKKLPEEQQKKLAEEEVKKREAEEARARAAVTEQLDKISTADSAVLFKVALLYAAVQEYEKANATYQKILDKSGAQDIVLLNMSENFFALNQNEKALEYAQKALNMSPDNNVVKETYALRLVNVGGEENLQKAFDILDTIVMGKSATQRGVVTWYNLMQDKLAKAIESKDWHEIKTAANNLLLIFPQDQRATEALKQADALLKEEAEKDNEAAKEEEEKK